VAPLHHHPAAHAGGSPDYNNFMSAPPDVLILGGGVIGLTSAYFLARESLKVEVVDKGDFGREASWAGAGIIPPGNPERTRNPVDLLRAYSATQFPRLSAELREATGIDNGYLRSGGIEWLREDEDALVQSWRGEGIRFELCESAHLRKLESALAPNASPAYFSPEVAQVRNPRHLRALLSWCENRVALRPRCEVQAFVENDKRILAADTAAGRMTAGNFLVAAGAWTDSLLASIGCRLDIHPVRGQIALLNSGRPLLTRILLDGKQYLVPRADGRVLVGSTEEDVGFEKRTTASAIAELLTFAQSLVPALANAEVEQCWAGLRPGSRDGLPFLGRVPGYDNLFVAAGHFRSGIQLSPVTGLVMKELIMGQTPTVPLEAFRPDRPPAPPVQSAFRS
jgi:glycine oxidase